MSKWTWQDFVTVFVIPFVASISVPLLQLVDRLQNADADFDALQWLLAFVVLVIGGAIRYLVTLAVQRNTAR